MLRLVRCLASALVLCGFVLFSGCGHDHVLIGVTVSPATFTLQNVVGGENIQFTATGEFVHPPGTRDISHQVVWSTPASDVITIDQNGLATVTGKACGTDIPVNATASQDLHMPPSGNVVTGTATVTVNLVGC
jgi:hypothetical protein